jgi:hypothetical protein
VILVEPWAPDWYQPPASEIDKMADPWWRLNHLYHGVDENGREYPFVMRPQQSEFYWAMWYLNILLKSRQHGFTTLLCLLGLDRCIWVSNYHAHIIAHTREDSERIFADKIRFPYLKLREEHPELEGSEEEILEADQSTTRVLRFKNGSVISCGQSMRSGTLQFLHISEYGKICAKMPDKAKEIRSGSLNTVHPGNIITIESTAEGRVGDFYTKCAEAEAKADQKAPLSKLDFKFFFFPWWRDAKNVLDPRGVVIPVRLQKYFRDLRRQDGIVLTPGQKAWYVKREEQNRDLMFREHPSTSSEAFLGQTEGRIFGKQLIMLRRAGRVQPFLPLLPNVPVETTWDLGKNDENAIWFHQWNARTGLHRWLHYYANHGHGLKHYWNYLLEYREAHNCFFGRHYLPHDVEVSELSMAKGETRKDYLEQLGMRDIIVVQRVPNINDGIEAARQVLEVSEFSEEGCHEGIVGLENYMREYDEKTESFKDNPRHDQASNAADAFRQICQEWSPQLAYRSSRKKPRNWRTA